MWLERSWCCMSLTKNNKKGNSQMDQPLQTPKWMRIVAILQMTFYSTQLLSICIASSVNCYPQILIWWSFEILSLLYPALHGLSSAWKGYIIVAVAHVNSVWGYKLVLKRMSQDNETPTSFICCAALSEEEQGVSKCLNLIQGTMRLMLNVSHGRALGSFTLLRSYLLIPTSEKNICVLSRTDAVLLKKKDSQKYNTQKYTDS